MPPALSALTALALAATAAPAAPGTVALSWKPSADATRALELEVKSDPRHRELHLDLRGTGHGARTDLVLPARTATLVVVQPGLNADKRRFVLVPTALEPGPGGPKVRDPHLNQVATTIVATESGLFLSEVNTGVRSTFGPVLELPPGPLAPGATWKLELPLFDLAGPSWTEEAHPIESEGKLVEVRAQPDGTHLAVIELKRTEKLRGHLTDASGKKTAVSFSSALSGHGEFLVEAGTWRELRYHFEEQGSGLGKIDLAFDATARPAPTPEPARQAVLASASGSP
jgi:hypothetical protein